MKIWYKGVLQSMAKTGAIMDFYLSLQVLNRYKITRSCLIGGQGPVKLFLVSAAGAGSLRHFRNLFNFSQYLKA